MFRYRLLFFVLLFMLSGCELLERTREPKDSGPDEPLDVSAIPDAVPTNEPRMKEGNFSPYTVLGKTYHVVEYPKGFRQTGIASWYGTKFHGRLTANGEVYNMYGMTAAHKTLPIPSYVRVTNVSNQKSVIVRVNDRGPFHDDRIIDLTYTAASKLGFVDKGTAEVKIEYIDPNTYQPENREGDSKGANSGDKQKPMAKAPQPVNSAGYALPDNTYLQVGAFSQLSSADELKSQLRALTDYPIDVLFPGTEKGKNRSSLFKVQIGPFTNNADLQSLRLKLMQANYPLPHIVYRDAESAKR